jgi:hypothetical protein
MDGGEDPAMNRTALVTTIAAGRARLEAVLAGFDDAAMLEKHRAEVFAAVRAQPEFAALAARLQPKRP